MGKRFVVQEEQHISGGILKIVVDTETGVHYLTGSGMGVSGITPLLDEKGNVIATKGR